MVNNPDNIFSTRKIPVDFKSDEQIEASCDKDKIKIIELCNAIDKWEQEILLGENGFFSLSGEEPNKKSKEFLEELNSFINSKISQIHFKETSSRDIAIDIKTKKIKAIQKQMEEYAQQQLSNWETQVFEEAVNSCIQRAVSYKTSVEIVKSSYQNAMAVLDFMAKKEKWSPKTKSSRKKQFESEFYSSIINSLVEEKNPQAFVIFNKVKDKLEIEDKEETEKSITKLKNNVIAYNWAQELLSYNLADEENEQEINSIEDSDIKGIVKDYIKAFKSDTKLKEQQEEDIRNEENWQEIISVLEKEPDKAFLYLDYSLDKVSQNAKMSYIKDFRADGYIKTKEEKFIELIKNFNENFEEFKKESISDYRAVLSKEDYELIAGLKDISADDYSLFAFDGDYIAEKLPKSVLSSDKELYKIIKALFVIRKIYIKSNHKEP
ncbi:hypothetical protein II906_01005, partial [bacterium]|nr:hypothetical protein [bacterium]